MNIVRVRVNKPKTWAKFADVLAGVVLQYYKTTIQHYITPKYLTTTQNTTKTKIIPYSKIFQTDRLTWRVVKLRVRDSKKDRRTDSRTDGWIDGRMKLLM